MDVDCIPFAQTGYFPKLILDYLDKKEDLRPFCGVFPEKDAFKSRIMARQKQFTGRHREVLHRALTSQNSSIVCSESTSANIGLLQSANTFTVVTGHQLNLFTGPLYFLYKIASAIKLCSTLKTAYPEFNFVPVYWMATEDHDFEEINHFTFKGKKLRWNRNSTGAVGRLDTKGLKAVYETFKKEAGGGEKAETLKSLFTRAYLEHETLGAATRYLVNALFGQYGLVIADGDDPGLKKLLVPYMKSDILDNLGYQKVSESIDALNQVDESYGIQVNPREINYFYLQDGLRERITSTNGKYYVVNTKISFSEQEMVQEIEAHPERFSPNVIARPLYQEVVLPNLCYIGGGGELAYWLELKGMFDALELPFPILMLRNSVLFITAKQGRRLSKLSLDVKDLFLEQHSLINKKIREISNIDIDFSPQRQLLVKQFEQMYALAEKTDKSFLGAVKAQETKQLKGLDMLEKRLLKAQKRKLQDHVKRLASLQNELFPGQGLQERQQNFSDLYLELGEELIPVLMDKLQAFPSGFKVLRY